MLGPLHICYGCWFGVWWGLLTVGVGVSLTLLPTLKTFFLLLGCLALRVCAWPYCILLCHIGLMSLEGLLFLGERVGGGEL